jgi:uncharacterized membrane protein
VAFFFKYSVDQGWLTEWVRLAIGLATGIALVALGFRGAGKGEPLGTVLAGGGIATFFITGFVGHQWFGLISYPLTFGFLFAASALGVLLALRSGLQALAIVGMFGSLLTPLILAPPTADVAGLALYVALIVASVGAVYMIRAWRAVFLLTAVASWWILGSVLYGAPEAGAGTGWVLQGVILFCALTFWLVPLVRARLRAAHPQRWLRPESAFPPEIGGPETGLPFVTWNVHLDALSLFMPLTAIGFSAWLWELSRLQLGWVFLAGALLAQGVGAWLTRSPDPEESASTQSFVAILLSTVGLGLVLTGDVLYLAFMAEAAALVAVGSRKESPILMGMGVVVEILVAVLFISHMVFGSPLLDGNPSSAFDFLAVAGGFFIGTRLPEGTGRTGGFVLSYLALLVLTAHQLAAHPTYLYLAYVLIAVGTRFLAFRWKNRLVEQLGNMALALVVVGFVVGIQSGRTLLDGDFLLLVDLAAVAGVVYMGTLSSDEVARKGLFAAAYLAGLALFFREMAGHPSVLYLTCIVVAVATQVTARRWNNLFLSALGHVPVLLFWTFLGHGFETERTLSGGSLDAFLDLAALAAMVWIALLLKDRRLRIAYLYAAYGGVLGWTYRELHPLAQAQPLTSLALGVEGAMVLVWGLVKNQVLMQKTGMATLLLVLAKVLLVDLAAVEPVWRVLLLFVFAVLFLGLSRFVQGLRAPAGTKEPSG